MEQLPDPVTIAFKIVVTMVPFIIVKPANMMQMNPEIEDVYPAQKVLLFF
jgi:hypothetical protein